MVVYCCSILVTMRWNGTNITGVPTFIYHDELATRTDGTISPDGPGSLICSIPANISVTWSLVNDIPVSFLATRSFHQIQKVETPSLSQLALGSGGHPRSESFVNGLWFCRTSGARLYVGIYARSATGETE